MLGEGLVPVAFAFRRTRPHSGVCGPEHSAVPQIERGEGEQRAFRGEVLRGPCVAPERLLSLLEEFLDSLDALGDQVRRIDSKKREALFEKWLGLLTLAEVFGFDRGRLDAARRRCLLHLGPRA